MTVRLSSVVRLAAAAPLALVLLPGTAQATILTLEYTDKWTGATPHGESPWLTATFSDEGMGANQVKLVLEAGGLSRGEFVSAWLFNLDPDLDPRRLKIDPLPGLKPSRIREGDDRIRRGGAWFDLEIDFPTSHKGRFDQDDSAAFVISWISWPKGSPAPALTPESFDFTSSGKLALFTGAHIQGIGWCEDESGWVSGQPIPTPVEPVPEPGTLLLVGSGALGLASLRRLNRAEASAAGRGPRLRARRRRTGRPPR
jgi:hypothetical protein